VYEVSGRPWSDVWIIVYNRPMARLEGVRGERYGPFCVIGAEVMIDRG